MTYQQEQRAAKMRARNASLIRTRQRARRQPRSANGQRFARSVWCVMYTDRTTACLLCGVVLEPEQRHECYGKGLEAEPQVSKCV